MMELEQEITSYMKLHGLIQQGERILIGCSGGIDKFNKAQRKKYGENYSTRDGYTKDYFKNFDNILTKYMNQSLNDFYKNSKSYQKSKALVEKYNMTDWNELAKSNEEKIAELRRIVEKNH